jgi:hypothetical protein
MRSLFAKTLLWFLATTAVAIGGFIITTALTFSSPEPRGPFGMLLSVQVEEAKRAFETGGREALSAELAKFQQITEMQVFFTDAKGTDLITGQAHPELLKRQERRRWRLPFPFGVRMRVANIGCTWSMSGATGPSSSSSRNICGSSAWWCCCATASLII